MIDGDANPLALVQLALIGTALLAVIPLTATVGLAAALVPFGCIATIALRLSR